MRRGIGLAIAAVLVMVPQISWSQSAVSTGQVLGAVTDPDGAALPGVTVEARNADTGLVRRDLTGDGGAYQINLLPPGNYDVRADLSGFKSEVKKGVVVSLGSSVKVSFAMQLSAIEEEIVVTAEAPVIETTVASMAHAVGDRAIANLPLNGRDFTDFIALTPGTVNDTQGAIGGGRGGVNIGARAIQNSFNIDGSNSQSSFFGEERGGTRPPFTFSQAAIKEFQVIKSSYNLEFNASGGVINAITKSGTNELHGEVFGYYRDDSFISKNARGEEATDFDQKQYGFALGGPITRDKLHFFVSYDGQKFETPTFHEYYGIDDVVGEGLRFANIDEFAAAYQAITGLDYFTEIGTVIQTNDADVILAKLDWQLNDSHLLSIRDNYSNQEGENLTSSYRTAGRSNNGLEKNSFNSLVTNLNSVISDDAFNELILQYALEERPRTPNTTAIPDTQVGFGYDATFGQTNFHPSGLDEERLQIIDNFTYYAGDHAFKAGVNLSFVSYKNFFCRYCNGAARFAGWDDFFDGVMNRYRQAFSDYDGKVNFDSNYYTFFAQDEWRVNPNFTLTYGLRYDYQEHDQPQETNPLYPETGSIPNDDNNFAPRVGFAWDINGDGKQVLRGGAGYFYDNTPTLLNANALLNNGVRVITITEYCGEGSDCPTYPERWGSMGDLQGGRPDIFVFARDFENPETLRFSLGYERELLSDLSVGADVIYYKTEKLERKQDQNIAPTGELTADGRPIYEDGTVYPDFGQIKQFNSDAEAKYRAIILKARKRYSNGWMLDTSYTWAEAEDNDSNERSVSSSSDYPEDQYNLDADWGPSNFDARHKFVVSATYQLPWDFMISAIGVIRSGFPYSAMDARDNNGDGYSRNERAVVEVEPGVFVHYARNTERQPYFRTLDLRLAKIFRFGADLEIELIAECFNVFDNDNWTTSRTRLIGRDGSFEDDFGAKNNPGAPRQFQMGAKFRF